MILYNIMLRPVIYISNKGFRLYYFYCQQKKLKLCLKILFLAFVFISVLLVYTRSIKHSLTWYEEVHKALSDNQVNVALVEEHHEVLQYWFTAAHKGIVSSTGNLLVHIDGHPDSGTPAYDPDVALFKTPENGEQIQLLMQRNDIFILAAAYKDFVSKFIWVYPDRVNASVFGEAGIPGAEVKVNLGFYDRYHEGKLYTGMCACYVVHQAGSCDFTDMSGALLENFKGKCLTYRTLEMRLVPSSQASELLPRYLGKWKEPILLDIDEDYFGVMKGSDLLKGITFELIQVFNELLAKIFTVLNVNDETNTHHLLLNILHMIKVTCAPTLSGKRNCSIENLRHMQNFLTDTGLLQTPIGGRELSSGELLQLVRYISDTFTEQQIDQIYQVGFCLTVSPQTHKLDVERDRQLVTYETITVCHGINTPYSENQIKVPNSEELEHLTEAYENVLKLIPTKRVKLVTVARSNRDGFTPRHLQTQIEELVLQSLNAKFVDANIIHDPNLMLHLGQGIVVD